LACGVSASFWSKETQALLKRQPDKFYQLLNKASKNGNNMKKVIESPASLSKLLYKNFKPTG
jgi:hypothetical protein